MLQKILLILVATVVLSASFTGILHFAYPFVLASKEAQESETVTSEQSAELQSAALASDAIAFAIFGGIICTALPFLLSDAPKTRTKMIGAASGLALGAATGSFAGWIGHWIERTGAFDIADPLIYSVVRWVIMLAATGIAAGAAVALACNKLNNAMNIVIGSLLGIVTAAITYAMLVGMVTTAEGRHLILPFYPSNRAMLFASVFAFVGIWILLQLRIEPAKSKGDTSDAVPPPTN